MNTPSTETAEVNDSYWIVGDRFAAFAEAHPDKVKTFQQFLRMDHTQHSFLIGQGLHDSQRLQVARTLAGDGQVIGLPIRSTLAHKHEAKNVLVSECERTGDDAFRCHLLLDDRNEQLSDHQTGMHISGMTLKEAVRQAMLVMTETHYIVRGASPRLVFVLQGFREISFETFVWPLPAQVEIDLTKAEIGHARMSFSASFHIVQEGVRAMSASMDWLVMDKSRFSSIELAKSTQTLEAWSMRKNGARR